MESPPTRVAQEDVRRGVEMFRTVDVPVLGVIENMSTYICGRCGTETPIFGRGGGGERTAKAYRVPFLGAIPLHRQVQQGSDSGEPIAASDPDAPLAKMYRDIAERVWRSLAG